MQTLPLGPGVTVVAMESVDPSLYSETHGGQIRTRKVMGQRWRLTFEWPRMRPDQARPIYAFLAGRRGRHLTFDVIPPAQGPLGVGTGAVTVTTAGQTGSALETTGWQASTAGVLKAGDLIRLAHGKVYMLTADANSDANGVAVLSIVPDLIVSPAAGETVVYRDVPVTVRLDTDEIQYSQTGELVKLRATMLEDVL